MFKKHLNKKAIISALSICMIGASVLPAIAYQTDMTDPIYNNFTIALDSTSTVLEKFPDPTPDTLTFMSVYVWTFLTVILNPKRSFLLMAEPITV